MKIRIETITGKMIEREAHVQDWIDNNGNQYSTADVKGYKTLLYVIDRDDEGPIWGKKEQDRFN
jgi:hypothetical protein